MEMVCPFRMLIVSSDKPHLLPPLSFLKRSWLGVGTQLPSGTLMHFKNPYSNSESTSCLIHLTGVFAEHAKPCSCSNTMMMTFWGRITDQTQFKLCPKPHSFPATPDIPFTAAQKDMLSSEKPRAILGPPSRVLQATEVVGILAPDQMKPASIHCYDLLHARSSAIDPVPVAGTEALSAALAAESNVKSVLVSGVSGSGKSAQISSKVAHANLPLHRLSLLSQLSSAVLDSGAALRRSWNNACACAPAVLLIEDLEAAFPADGISLTDNQHDLLLGFLSLMKAIPAHIVVIAAVESVSNLRRRVLLCFEVTLSLSLPSSEQRLAILKIHLSDRVEASTLKILSDRTPGFTGADLEALCVRIDELQDRGLSALDAVSLISPSSLDNAIVSVPDTPFSSIGGLAEAKQALRDLVQWPLEAPESFARMGVRAAKGVLLFGPPGTGKTMLARAVATEAHVNFVSLGISDLIRSEVGESERRLADVFERARAASPCVVFIDEFQAIFGRRDAELDASQLVSQLMLEMDKDDGALIVLAATNRPDLIDEALLRPGRFDRVVLVGPPRSARERAAILGPLIASSTWMHHCVDVRIISSMSKGLTGAELAQWARRSALAAIERGSHTVHMIDWRRTLHVRDWRSSSRAVEDEDDSEDDECGAGSIIAVDNEIDSEEDDAEGFGACGSLMSSLREWQKEIF